MRLPLGVQQRIADQEAELEFRESMHNQLKETNRKLKSKMHAQKPLPPNEKRGLRCSYPSCQLLQPSLPYFANAILASSTPSEKPQEKQAAHNANLAVCAADRLLNHFHSFIVLTSFHRV